MYIYLNNNERLIILLKYSYKLHGFIKKPSSLVMFDCIYKLFYQIALCRYFNEIPRE